MNVTLKEASVKYAQSSTIPPSQADALQSELKAIVNEIQSLWDEVVPVAHMAVEKALLEPILKTVDTKKVSREHQNSIITTYVR
jgi:Holliday junction resolvasome RuvABC endonuclease subunit